MAHFSRLKKRSEFLCVYNAQISAASKTVITQLYQRLDGSCLGRIGFTVSRKVGNAVQRNRARRRLKAVSQEIIPLFSLNGYDIVIVARSGAVTSPYSVLLKDFRQTLSTCLKREKK